MNVVDGHESAEAFGQSIHFDREHNGVLSR
jgi:hypothetical protein